MRPDLRLLIVLSITAFPAIFASIFPSQSARAESPPESPPERELRVLAYDTEPFFYRTETGEPTGLEYRILESFAEAYGYRLRILWTSEFAELLPSLAAGGGDLAGGALTNTAERREFFDFTIAHFPALSLLVERRGKESMSIADLKGKRVVARRNSSNERILMGIEGVEIVHAPTVEAMFQMVLDGEVQGAATDSGPYLWRAESYPDLTTSLRLSERTFYGFATAKGNPAKGNPLKAEIDAYLRQVRDDGRYKEFLYAAFGKWGSDAVDAMSDGLFEDE